MPLKGVYQRAVTKRLPVWLRQGVVWRGDAAGGGGPVMTDKAKAALLSHGFQSRTSEHPLQHRRSAPNYHHLSWKPDRANELVVLEENRRLVIAF